MNAFIDRLMSRMTLQEKIGQMNFLDATEMENSAKVKTEIKRGLVGGAYVFAPGPARKLQSLAVKESRLGIPLLFAFDVIHGFKTISPPRWRFPALGIPRQSSRERASPPMKLLPTGPTGRSRRW